MAKKTKSQPNKSQKSTASKIKDFKLEAKKKALIQSQFKILDNETSMAKMSSEDMLIIAQLLEKETAPWATHKKNQLNRHIKLKIERTEQGEILEDVGFDRLKRYVEKRKEKQAERVKKQNTPKQKVSTEKKVEEKKEEKKKQSSLKAWFKKNLEKIKRTAVVVGVGILTFAGVKMASSHTEGGDHSDPSVSKERTEQTITPPQQQKTVETISELTEAPTITVEETVTSNLEAKKNAAQAALDVAYKNRFDTSLEILLGVEGREKIYEDIAKLADAGKIEYKDGTTQEWYAHAFTMYQKVAPYSEDGQTVSRFLAGEDVKPEVLHDLVVKAKRDGSGVKGTGTHSSYNEASKDLQQKHDQNKKQVKSAEIALQTALNAQSSRS